MSIGPAEIIIVLILALLVFGPKRLPQMGRSLGKGVREFRKAADTAKTELGLGEVTDQINEVKSSISEPLKDVKSTFGDLKESVDVKAAIEAPVATAAATDASATAAASSSTGTAEEGPETPAITPQTAFADLPQTPAPRETTPTRTAVEDSGGVVAPDAPEAVAAPEAPAGLTDPAADPAATGA